MLDRPAISRVLQDLLRAEIAVSRGPAAVVLPSYPWPETLHIGADLGADSLELMALSGAVNEFFHLHDCGIEETLLQRRRLGDWVDLARQACMEASPSITFRSSGTTGAPKPIAHRLHGLAAEAAEHLARLDPGRILTAVPSHHIYGFIFGALMPSLAGCEVVNLRAGLPCRGGFRAGDVIVSVPEHWGFLARSFGSLPQLSGVTSTSPMHADLARDLTSAGAAIRMRPSRCSIAGRWQARPPYPAPRPWVP
jgi:4-coumarate--CoA ligase (photoactive yellow protein activation family)